MCAGHARATSLPGRTLVASRCVVEVLDVVHSRRGGMPATELGERGRVAAVAGWAVTAEDGSHGGAGRDTPSTSVDNPGGVHRLSLIHI